MAGGAHAEPHREQTTWFTVETAKAAAAPQQGPDVDRRSEPRQPGLLRVVALFQHEKLLQRRLLAWTRAAGPSSAAPFPDPVVIL
jgi:hypothetical protein